MGSNPVAPADYDPIATAVEFAWKNGITVVCAAGNEGEFGPGGILSPGNSPYVITVGATDTRQTPTPETTPSPTTARWARRSSTSSRSPTSWRPGNRLISLRVRGSYIDVNYPQNLIPLADLRTRPTRTPDPDYLMLSGTSTAAPVTAGAVAAHDRRGRRPEPG